VFRAELERTLKEAIPTEEAHRETPRPLRLFSQDESRFGLISVQRRRITLKGVKPVGTFQQKFESFYVYGAVEPATGEGYFEEADRCNSATFGDYLKGFSRRFPDRLNLLLLDNGGHHTAKRLEVPDNVVPVFLPPYSPELNPIERVWQGMKDGVAWLTFDTLDPLREKVRELLSEHSRDRLQSLTGYGYILQALESLKGSFLS